MTNCIWTIEINQDDDYANACSYHVDNFISTSARNLRIACQKETTSRWALVGLANSQEEAMEKCQRLRLELCKINNRNPYGIEELIYKIGKKDL